MNGGPGVIGGLFVHDRHGKVESVSATPAASVIAAPDLNTTSIKAPSSNGDSPRDNDTQLTYRPRLSGWWGSDKDSRFLMNNEFVPISGASGFQLSNPSALDMTAVLASLDVFSLTTIDALRARSINLTAYLEARLLRYDGETTPPYKIITPSNPAERGAQLSVLLIPGMLEHVLGVLEEEGVVVDERKPDVIRIAPAPLYNSFWDIHRFMEVFLGACKGALDVKEGKKGETGAPVKNSLADV
jgi:kynureninase